MYTHSPEHQLAARWPEQACKAASSGPLLQRAAGRPVKRGFVCLGSRKGERQCSHLAVCQHGASETVGKWLWAHRLWRCRALPGRPHTRAAGGAGGSAAAQCHSSEQSLVRVLHDCTQFSWLQIQTHPLPKFQLTAGVSQRPLVQHL